MVVERGETLGCFGDFIEKAMKVSAEGVDLCDGLAKFLIEGFAFFYLFG